MDIVAVIGMNIVVPTSLGVPFLYVSVVCGCTVESTQYALQSFSLKTAKTLSWFAAGATFAPTGDK